jgi:hypothetical protein
MGTPNSNRRVAPRKEVSPIHVSYLTSLDDFAKIAKNCEIVEASSSGLLLLVRREDLIPQALRKNLNLEEMNIEISGVITRTQLTGKKGFHLAVDYTDDAPEYWRECLMDLLPSPGEMD